MANPRKFIWKIMTLMPKILDVFRFIILTNATDAGQCQFPQFKLYKIAEMLFLLSFSHYIF